MENLIGNRVKRTGNRINTTIIMFEVSSMILRHKEKRPVCGWNVLVDDSQSRWHLIDIVFDEGETCTRKTPCDVAYHLVSNIIDKFGYRPGSKKALVHLSKLRGLLLDGNESKILTFINRELKNLNAIQK